MKVRLMAFANEWLALPETRRLVPSTSTAPVAVNALSFRLQGKRIMDPNAYEDLF
jgi:hypothetical protein